MTAGIEHTRKEIRRALLTCVPYFLIVFFLDDIDKVLYTIHSRFSNPLIVLYLLIASVIILSLILHECIDMRANYKASGYMAIIPFVIYLTAILNSFWSPLRISSDIFKSPIVYKAYRRSHYGHDQIRLRQNGNMDIRYPGILGISDWEYGHWSGRGDTFYLDYDRVSDTVYAKPDTLILASDGLLAPLGIPGDTLTLYKDQFFRIPVTKSKK